MRFTNAGDLDKPAMMTLEKGTSYWCRCGRTQGPPFCDGSHEGHGITPLAFESDGKTPIAICMCGLTKKPPHCDGSHRDY
jgi:CDGSH iron-sulfur domain-containing protein 3